MGPWWLTWHLCLYICEKCEMSRLWRTNTRTHEQWKVEQYSVWTESAIYFHLLVVWKNCLRKKSEVYFYLLMVWQNCLIERNQKLFFWDKTAFREKSAIYYKYSSWKWMTFASKVIGIFIHQINNFFLFLFYNMKESGSEPVMMTIMAALTSSHGKCSQSSSLTSSALNIFISKSDQKKDNLWGWRIWY